MTRTVLHFYPRLLCTEHTAHNTFVHLIAPCSVLPPLTLQHCTPSHHSTALHYPLPRRIVEACKKHPRADVFVNFASFRR